MELPLANATIAYTGTITHPSGAVGAFTFQAVLHGRSHVPDVCVRHTSDGFTQAHYSVYPRVYGLVSLTRKTITGPGLAPQTWSWQYGPANESWEDECAAGCADTKAVEQTDPDGNRTLYTFGNRFMQNEGKLLQVDTGGVTGTWLRSEGNVYQFQLAGQPYAAKIGTNPNSRGERAGELRYPLRQRSIAQQGEAFTWTADTFDVHARVLRATGGSSLGYSRARTAAYHDDLDHWVIDQVASVTCSTAIPTDAACNGDIESQATYDALARPLTRKVFGKLQHTLAYYSDGNLKTYKDGRNNVTTFSSWYRGIPRLTTHPDATTQAATVNPIGTIASVTNEMGAKTCYAYDAMGRLTQVTYPSETQSGVCDTAAWNATTQAFAQVSGSEYGIPAGHWRQTVSTGNGVKIVYYDAMWRPLVTREYDAGNVAATQRFVRHAYDGQGRTVFASYPSTGSSPTTGLRTVYDALGRPTSMSQDSELGLLTTTTEYLTGFKTRVTNPRGFQTTTHRYQVYDEPTMARPMDIYHPEGARTLFGRDVFGKPRWVQRRTVDGSTRVSRWFVYDTYQQLCKTIEPETASTVMAYDAAGNLAWSAGGQALGSSSDCNTPSVPAAAKVVRTYDSRNRLTSLAFPDGQGDTVTSYTPDGLPTAITAYNGSNIVTTSYTYNKRRLLELERLQWPAAGINWPIGYTYNANGHPVSQVWHGLNITYAPNALGQATQAGSYATNASYFPNGALKQFTYGNGIVHTLTQNARGLPERSRDAYGATAVHDDSVDFDQNGNVAAISDGLAGNRGDRTMTYDGLDRLTDVTSPMYGTTGAHYSYDVLDNLKTVVAPGRNHTYVYDGYNRLTNVTSGGVSVIGLGYDVQGNLANKNGTLYDFDYGNRLRSVTGIASYIYDGLGRRVRDATTASKYSQYTHAGHLALTSNLRTGIVSDYVYLGGSLVAIRERYGTTYTTKYQHTDALGTPVAVTAANRVVLERSEYEPYGKVTNRPMHDGPGYTGHVEDAATGLVYMQQRYYDPLGRFLSVDPVTAYDTGDLRQFNRYAYANNNPYLFTDPDGRLAVPMAVGGCAITGPACPIGAGVGALIGKGLTILGVVILMNEMSEGSDAPAPEAGGDIVIPDDVKDQLGERGWTEGGVREVASGEPVGTTVDNTGGKTGDKGEPATVYGSKDGGHVIVNDKTKEVIQVTPTNDPDWVPDSRIDWKE